MQPLRHDASDVPALLERELYLAALDALDVGLLVVDSGMRVLLTNKVFERTFGRQPDEVTVGEPGGFEVLRSDGSPWPVFDRPLAQAVRTGRTTDGELMGLRRDGRTMWTRVSARPLYRRGEREPYAGLITYTDVTAQLAADAALRDSEAHFRLLAENATDIISRHNRDGTCTYVSPALRDVLGWQVDDVVGKSPLQLCHPDDREFVVEEHDAVRRDLQPRRLRYRMLHRDGHWVWCESVVRPVRGEDGQLDELQTSSRDVSARVEVEERLERLALADPLTGLANRAVLTRALENLLEQGERLSLLFLDLDRFKVVNDSLGHSAGDELLRTVAGRLAATCRDGDVVARLGGDEFVVVAPGLDELGALRLADRIQQVLAAPIGVGNHELVVSASVGIVAVGPDAPEQAAETLLRDADVSMYRAKDQGRARAVVWTEAYGEAANTRLELERDLRAALEHDQLVVHYQPKFDLRSDRVVAVEALVRWEHPTRGLLLPGAFLDVAEDSGLLARVGRHVLTRAATQVAAWRQLPGCGELRLSVNLSAQELTARERRDESLAVLADAGLPPSAVTLEVLESVLLDADVVGALQHYRRRGFVLALDDFGTGSSSLLHLRHVPVGVVKLDRTFVAGLGNSRHDEAIVRAVRAVTTDLGVECVAEGVEQEHQREWLLAHGICVAQGFLLCPPLPADEVTELLRRVAPGEVSGSGK